MAASGAPGTDLNREQLIGEGRSTIGDRVKRSGSGSVPVAARAREECKDAVVDRSHGSGFWAWEGPKQQLSPGKAIYSVRVQVRCITAAMTSGPSTIVEGCLGANFESDPAEHRGRKREVHRSGSLSVLRHRTRISSGMCGVAGRFAVQGPLLGGGHSAGQGSPLEHRLYVGRPDQGQFRLPAPRRELSTGDYDYDYDYGRRRRRRNLRCAQHNCRDQKLLYSRSGSRKMPTCLVNSLAVDR